MEKIKMICSHCGSTNVTRDAMIRWDETDQQWKLCDLLDNTDCDDCGGETQIIEKSDD